MVEKEVLQEDKHLKIIEAAQKRFAHFGLEKTTMTDISDDIGVSKAAIYYYFKDKESIFKEVLLKEQSAFCSQMNKLIESDNEIGALLKKYIEKRTEYLKTLLNLGKLNYEAFRANKPLFGDLGKKFHEREKKIIKDMLDRAIKRNEITKLDTGEYSEFFVNILRALRLCELEKTELWEKGGMDIKIEQNHLFFTKIFLNSIKIR